MVFKPIRGCLMAPKLSSIWPPRKDRRVPGLQIPSPALPRPPNPPKPQLRFCPSCGAKARKSWPMGRWFFWTNGFPSFLMGHLNYPFLQGGSDSGWWQLKILQGDKSLCFLGLLSTYQEHFGQQRIELGSSFYVASAGRSGFTLF